MLQLLLDVEAIWLNLLGLLEVPDGILVVSKLLVDLTPLNKGLSILGVK
jgi:hypothetical protein